MTILQATEAAQGTMKAALSVLEGALATKTFLVGERVTLADIACVCSLLLPYRQVSHPDPSSFSSFFPIFMLFFSLNAHPCPWPSLPPPPPPITLQVFDPSFRDPYVNVHRWFTTCINQPQFKEVLGDFKICTKAATFDGELTLSELVEAVLLCVWSSSNS